MTVTTRVLVAARLSRINNGEQGRIDRDDADARAWAESRSDVEIVAVSEDAGVSGATSPFKRPSLGHWLTDPGALAQYDEIVASSIDRLGRSARDLQELRHWAEDNGKTIRILTPELVWPLPEGVAGATGRIIWEVLGALSQIERELIKERYANQRNALLDKGAFVGKPPWGYIVVGDKFNKSLEPDPALKPYLRGMVERAMHGDTYLSICRWLDGEGVPSASGEPWSPSSVASVLHNPALMGRRREGGKLVMKFDSLLSAPEFAALQQEFDQRPSKRGPVAADTAMLTGIIVCEKCGGPMYHHNSKTKRKDGTYSVYRSYRCKGADQAPSRCGNSIRAEDLEDWANAWFTSDGAFARTEIVEIVTERGDDHADEILEIELDLRDLDFDAPDFAERQAALLSERAGLRSLPSEPSQVIEHPTGQTVGDVWVSLDDQQRRRFLLAGGIKVCVRSNAELRKAAGYRQNPEGPAGLMLRQRMVIPRPESWGEPVEREAIYVTGDPSRIEGALASLTAGLPAYKSLT